VAKRQLPKAWIAITSLDGMHHGEYEVSDGSLTVRLGSRHKTTRAPSTGLPASLGANADKSLARLMLGELL
jgi:hypothetical protein